MVYTRMFRGAITKHVLFYSPQCPHSREFIQRMKSSRVAHDFDAFDVSVADPPSEVTAVPTIRVMGAFLTGDAAFDWLARVDGSGEKKETPAVIPDRDSGARDDQGMLAPMASSGLDYSELPPGEVAGGPGGIPQSQATRGADEGEMSLEDRLKQLQQEREVVLGGVASAPVS